MSDYRPPAVQGATGLKADADFNPPTGPIETLKAWVRGRWYEMPAADAKRLRPTFVRSERAIANERHKAERREKMRRLGVPIHTDSYGDIEPDPPSAEILPAARRGTPAPYDDPGEPIVLPKE
jgi:hypothetical protein